MVALGDLHFHRKIGSEGSRGAPDFSTLSRREKTLAVNLPCRGSRGPLNLLVGSTAIKVGDAPMLPALLDQIRPDQEIGSVTTDGAYDTRKCLDAIADRGAAAVVPPHRNARHWKLTTTRDVVRFHERCR